MRSRYPWLYAALALALAFCGTSFAQSLGDFLAPGVDISDPAQRADVVSRMGAVEQARREAALRLAAQRGLPVRVKRPDGAVMELMALENGEPVYAITHNVNAAISTGANLLRGAPLSLTGNGVKVGLWDGGSARATHQEFGGRVTVKDGAVTDDHATHVGGTIAAAGVDASARGMATAATVDSYEWTSDKSEMTARGATYPGEPGKIYLSNHSYGYISGWRYTGGASPVWDWWGNGTTSTGVEADFGRYDTNARDSDSLAASAPYYLIFRSAGNERYDNPGTGQPVALTAGGNNAVSYDPAVHPPGDGLYRSGYDTVAFDAVAKNVMTIGSVSDAVSGGVRVAGVASLSGFSSCGPTDDGRIKPDVVANGDNLYSSLAGSDSAYGAYSGTSMSTPNASGSAALLVHYFDTLFPGQAMRASTLKALLIHTADDLGTPGPDYQHGWGLLNAKAAADALSAYHANPGNARVLESRLTSAVFTHTHSFTWDGTSPIRATLVWTDPAGTTATTGDNRTARLVNNLDLKIVAPDSVNHSPFVMPFVGTWTNANLSAPATPGKNNTDNVEQVFLASPTSAGTYSAVVTVDGTLSGGVQNYSLVITGGVNVATAPAPTTSAVSPASGNSGTVVLTVTGGNFLLGATVKLTKTGQPDIVAAAIESLGDLVKCRADLTGRASGLWNVVVTNPDGQSATLPGGFSIIGALWQDELEGAAPGWTPGNWALIDTTSTYYHSATHSFFAAGPASTNINDLYSPEIAISESASNLTLSFWHNFNFQSRRDGGVLEFSIDGGAWFDVTASGSGAAFATGGYNDTFINTGPTSNRNPLAPHACWTGSNTGFTQVVVNLTDTTKYADHKLRIRWRLATNNSTASAGWYLDDIALNGGGAVNLAPSITTAAAAAPSPVAGSTTALSVGANDDAGEPGLIYTWSYTGGSFLTPVEFSENGTNAAKNTTATFSGAGSYTFTATVRDAESLTATSSVDVIVEQTATSITVTPVSATVGKGATQLFAASVRDQFGATLTAQPTVSWSAGGGGSIDSGGLFTATTIGGPFSVTATSGSLNGFASITVTGQRLTDWRTAHFTPAEITAGLADNGLDADFDGLTNLLEYAIGTNPRAATALPSAELDATGHLSLTLIRPKSLPDVILTGEAGDDLATWPTSVPIEVLVEGDPEMIRLIDPLGIADRARRFLRLHTAPAN